jgi:epsilon-lactone hydrolase
VATLCTLRDAGQPLPAAAALLCPWTEPFAAGGSMDAHAAFDFGDRELLAGWAQATLAGGDAADPRFTVTNAKLAGLPPLLVQVGGVELLHDQVLRFVERARAAGVETRLEVLPEMFHVVHLQAALLPEGAAAVASVAAFLREHTEK